MSTSDITPENRRRRSPGYLNELGFSKFGYIQDVSLSTSIAPRSIALPIKLNLAMREGLFG